MKRIFVFPALLLLAACSSAGDAYNIGRNIDSVGASNARVTGMRTSVDNRLEVIDYAQKTGVLSLSESASDNGGAGVSRVGFYGPGLNREPNVREPESEKLSAYYQAALTAFQDMLKIHNDGISDDMSVNAVKNAYLIAGGTDTFEDLTNDEVKGFIDAKYESVLDRFFNFDLQQSVWMFEPKQQSLQDVKMKMVSGDDVLTFSLDDNGQIIAAYFGDNGYTRTGSNTHVFWRKDPDSGDETTMTLSAGHKLKYSDYGQIVMTTNHTDSSPATVVRNVFAGGYDLKNINREKVREMVQESDALYFTGTALGTVSGTDGSVLPISGDATLNVMNDSSGTERLDIKFSDKNWYDVVVVNNGLTQVIEFKPNDSVATKYTLTELSPSGTYDGMNLEYYGDRGVPGEFVGTMTYTDGTNGVSMNAAFGGTLTKPETTTP